MTHLIGIDTGGTFTDAVVMDAAGDRPRLVAKAKALTTRHDLAMGVGEALRAVLAQSGVTPASVELVSLSTTLATNALVEGHGRRAALVAIGFSQRDLSRAGLDRAMGSDPVVSIAGGHDSHGRANAEPDLAALDRGLDALPPDTAAVAIAGVFAVRNADHELAVRERVRARTGLPVTCSHELSARLNGPRRALTTVLNARLVPLVARLVASVRRALGEAGVAAPLMVVRGDGALVSADFASARPIETILSGPAASLVGARFLTGLDRALVNDIGGTTSDIAFLEEGRPAIDPDGATVGGFRTMVEAVAMRTFGLGGDSAVSLPDSGLARPIQLGPQRAIPVSLLAMEHGAMVADTLARQAKAALPGRLDARFALVSPEVEGTPEGAPGRLLARLRERGGAAPLDGLLQGRAEEAMAERLAAEGWLRLCGPTPSDALHVLGEQSGWDGEAAQGALTLLARRRDGAGRPVAQDAHAMARRIVARLERLSADAMLESAFAADGAEEPGAAVAHPLIAATLDRRAQGGPEGNHARIDVSLDRPVVGLGASAHRYHPAPARWLGVEACIPEDADVANAIGAVVGQVRVRAQRTVLRIAEECFRVTGSDTSFASADAAIEAARRTAGEEAERLALEAGAHEPQVRVSVEEKRAEIEGSETLVEATAIATASGRPRIG